MWFDLLSVFLLFMTLWVASVIFYFILGIFNKKTYAFLCTKSLLPFSPICNLHFVFVISVHDNHIERHFHCTVFCVDKQFLSHTIAGYESLWFCCCVAVTKSTSRITNLTNFADANLSDWLTMFLSMCYTEVVKQLFFFCCSEAVDL